LGQAEDLEPAAIRQDIVFPVAEVVQTAILPQNLYTRTEIEVIRVAENQVIPDIRNSIVVHSLYRTISAHRHKRRCNDIAMWQGNYSTTG
jgi:hypothetical protein